MKRDYKREYKIFHSKLKEKIRRAGRNNARRLMLRMGRVKKHTKNGGDVHHINHRPWSNNLRNLRVIPKSKNRSIK